MRTLGALRAASTRFAPDLTRFLGEFLDETGAAVKPGTDCLMSTNHSAPGLTPRGLGLAVGPLSGSPGYSANTFGHTGSTGTVVGPTPPPKPSASSLKLQGSWIASSMTPSLSSIELAIAVRHTALHENMFSIVC